MATPYSSEALEGRTLLATFVVSDNGQPNAWGSFVAQINNANGTPGPDVIVFNLPASKLRLTPEFMLPITEAVTIDATTQPGFAGKPIVELDGSALPGIDPGLLVQASNVTVRGLSIHSCPGHGIVLADEAANSIIEGNYIGTDATGTVDKGNGFGGINIFNSSGNRIGGASPQARNVIVGNTENGVGVVGSGSTGNTIIGNYIGVDATGLRDLGNDGNGVFVTSNDAAGPGAPVANTVGGDSTAERNVISGNGANGVRIGFGASGNRVLGNYVGVAADGMTPRGNSRNGVQIEEANSNEIGGVLTGEGNLISANQGAGVAIRAVFNSARNNKVRGNLIGTNKDGDFGPLLGNVGNGVELRNESAIDATTIVVSDNLIGGADLEDGAVDGAIRARNVVSGNGGDGVSIVGHRMTGTIVKGNLIGLDGDGVDAVRNAGDGVHVATFAGQAAGTSTALIGGVDAGAGNVISANGRDGVFIGFGARAAVIANTIGSDEAGVLARGNARNGILVLASSGNVIGQKITRDGVEVGVGNVIVSNGLDGVQINGRDSKDNLVEANIIGADAGQALELGNARHGIFLIDAPDNTIGDGTEPGANVIVNSGAFGVTIVGDESKLNLVLRNHIGTNPSGEPLGNALGGVQIAATSDGIPSGTIVDGNVIAANRGIGVGLEGGTFDNVVRGNFIGLTRDNVERGNVVGVFIKDAPRNIVGGASTAARNIISSNTASGISVVGAGSMGNRITGNFIGTDTTGELDKGNAAGGVFIFNASETVVGGPSAAERNVISGNGDTGVTIEAASRNRVEGNYIGVDVGGAKALANDGHGVLLSGATDNSIGAGSAPTQTPGGNVISGNAMSGVHIGGAGATRNKVLGNLIGLDAAGARAVPNALDGVTIFGSSGNTIGGSIADGGNVISGNAHAGVRISQILESVPTGNRLLGNFIGADVHGAIALGNLDGVVLDNAAETVVGDTTSEFRNVVSGNLGNGIAISGLKARANVLRGNYVGANFLGTGALRNVENGVVIRNAPDTVIGGMAVGAGNVVSANGANGILIDGADAHGTMIFQNSIGSGPARTEDLGNARHGVLLQNEAFDNRIGDSADRAGNTIAHNGAALGRKGHGVVVQSGAGNAIRHNLIFANAGRGIDLVNAAKPDTFTLNDPKDEDAGANALQNYPVVTLAQVSGDEQRIRWSLKSTPDTPFLIDFFASSTEDPSGFGEAERFLSSVEMATDSNGVLTLERTFGKDDRISATATNNVTHNTSEFSMVDSDGDALADAWERRGVDFDEDGTVDYELLGADPLRKDVYVEVDAMIGLAPTRATLDRVELAFAAAPVDNPDGSAGINLHVTLDEIIPRQRWTSDLDGDGLDAIGEDRNGNSSLDLGEDRNGNRVLDAGDADDQGGFPFFNRVKQGLVAGGGGFGTVSERGNGARLASKRLVSKYAIFADQFALPGDPIGTTLGTSGIAEFIGNDFIVSLGDKGWANTADEQAGTFMHELGHTLGLDHGGKDDTNRKPNYHSVMNYLWQVPQNWMDERVTGRDENGDGDRTDALFNLVYSEQAFPTLDETDLNEAAGIGGHVGHWVPAGSAGRNAPETGPVDWNRDGVPGNATGVADNVNREAGTILEGYDDWSNLSFSFLDGADFIDGAPHSLEEAADEMDVAAFEQVNALGSSAGVFKFRASSFNVDESDGRVEIVVRRGGGTIGAVSVDYATADGTATAGADYTAASGTLVFAQGEYVKTITVELLSDLVDESTESFRLILSNPTGGTRLGDDGVATIDIMDDDDAAVRAVTTSADSGPGSLRQAILDANVAPGPDLIRFNIGAGGVQSIQPLSPLPAVTDSVVIDGTTQPGFAGKPVIELNGAGVSVGPGLLVNASNTIVRGLAINRFAGAGIQVTRQSASASPDNVRIEGNFIGVDVTGTLALGNGRGVVVGAGSGHRIGGTAPGSRNVISGNLTDGVFVFGGDGLTIEGNLIGLASDGATPLGNAGDGVLLAGSAGQFPTGVAVGGLEPGAGNVIAFNSLNGVESRVSGVGHAILSNSIHSNGLLGIEVLARLQGEPNEVDTDALRSRNEPVLASAITAGGRTTVSGYLNGRFSHSYRLEFFANTAVEPSGAGEGQTFLGSATVTTNGDGQTEFSVTLPVAVPDRRLITATATDALNDTSEFSKRLAVGDVLSSVITVNTTDDVDDGVADATHTSLREAIHAANNHPGSDLIRFAIGSGLRTITPATPLPAVVDPTTIDGATQPGFAGTPLIELAGTLIGQRRNSYDRLAGEPSASAGLVLVGDHNTVRGFAINRFADDSIRAAGLLIFGDNNVVEGNFIGVDSAGRTALPNSAGVQVFGSGNRIGGATPAARNLLSGNSPNPGLFVQGDETVIQGNYIGTDVAGTAALANTGGGVLVRGDRTVVGGSASGTGNVISGNFYGLWIIASGPRSDTVVQGNFIGVDATGSRALGNGATADGRLFARPVGRGVLIDGTGVTVGGTRPGEGNVIAGNHVGVDIDGTGVVVQGNRIGTDVTGTLDFGNRFDGIHIHGFNNRIGGTEPGAGNVISGNGRFGVLDHNSGDFSDPNTPNIIQGNRIGAAADGVTPLGNDSDGVAVSGNIDASEPGVAGRGKVLVGGLDPAAGNVIAFNGGRGVNIQAGRGTAVLSNSIHSNGLLGIDLDRNGVTANDPSDTDEGDNGLQNFPVLTAVVSDGVRTQVVGTLNSRPDMTYRLQFFASTAADPSGFGEGQTPLGTRLVITDAAGNATFTMTFPTAVPVGRFLTATATDPADNTSEFSQAVRLDNGAVGPNQPPTARAGGPYVIDEGGALTLAGAESADPDGDPLAYSWDVNGDGVFGDASVATPTLLWQQLKALGITDDTVLPNVRLRTDDGRGHVVTSTATTLTVRNVAPVLTTTPDQIVDENGPFALTTTFTDPGDADTHIVRWRIDDANGATVAEGVGAAISFLSTDNGVFFVHVTVTDDDGGAGTSDFVLFFQDVAPTAAIVGLPASGIIGSTVNLTASVIDVSPDDTQAGFSYQWFVVRDEIDTVAFGDQIDFSFTPTVAGRYDIALFVSDKDGGSVSVNATLIVTTGTPKVTDVFLNGTAWAPSFRTLLHNSGLGDTNLGYRVATGADQATSLPWTNINQITIRFDSPVSARQADLIVVARVAGGGANTQTLATSAFSLSADGRTATWTLARPLPLSRVVLKLDADAGGVASQGDAASALDGEYGADGTNGTLPSGDNIPGGDFNFRFNVVPGDVDRSGGTINASDLVRTRNRIGLSAANPGGGTTTYSVFADVNGDGSINAADLVLVRNRIGTSLPAVPPSLAFSASRITPTVRQEMDEIEEIFN